MTKIVLIYQPTIQAAKWALMEAGPVCVSVEVEEGAAIPDLGYGFYAYRARFAGVENDQNVYKLLELLPQPTSKENIA